MKIALVITVYFPSPIYGGPAAVTRDLSRELVRRGHSVSILTSNIMTLVPPTFIDEKQSDYDGVRVLRFPTVVPRARFSYLIAPGLTAWLKSRVRDFDVVFVQYARDWIPIRAAQVALRAGVGVVLQTHGMLTRTQWPRSLVDCLITRSQLRGADSVLALQEQEEREIQKICTGAKTTIVPNGYSVSDCMPRWNVAALSKMTMLFVGRLHPHKRVDILIEAAARAALHGLRVKFRIIGPDEGDKGRLLSLCRDRGVSDLFQFLGPMNTKEVLNEMASASGFILPSLYEQFSIAVLEALAIGVPVIITTGNRAADLLQRHDAVEVTAPDPRDIECAIRKILLGPELAERRSAHGRALIRNQLSLEHVVDSVEQILTAAAAKQEPRIRET